MTLELMTKSHGEVEAGFFSCYTQAARIGKYAFETKDLCYLAKTLIENPNTEEIHISGFDVDTFWDLFENYHMRGVFETLEKTGNPQEVKEHLEKNQGRMSLEEKTRANQDRLALPVKLKKDENTIKIGEYEIEYPEFTFMIDYLLHGGWMGWSENMKKPSFVDEILPIIKRYNPDN